MPSSANTKLSSEQIAFYEENGYLVVPNVFEEKILKEISDIASELANEAKKIEVVGENDAFMDLRGSSVVLKKNEKTKELTIKRIVWAGAASPKLLSFGRDPRIIGPVSQLLKQQEADHLINQLHFKHKGDDVEFLHHQDSQNRFAFDPQWQDDEGRSFVQTILAVDDNTLTNGPLCIYPRSNKLGFLNFGKHMRREELDIFLEEKKISPDKLGSALPMLMKRGDMLFMHPHIIHFSKPNASSETTESRRLIFINGYARPNANHQPYPGKNSGKRVDLTTGKEKKSKANSTAAAECTVQITY